ncbi:MAG: hypothetical protein KatS3mg024_0924 [Armatimonadota bacterium]|nr:MAG: hypothetical protein KatS3mg024_0924 [Armatimonadota bacterium]
MQIPDDPRQVLEMALNNEKQGYKILTDASAACDDKLAKATFEFLAREELKHMDIIKKYAETGIAEAPSSAAIITKADIAKGVKGIFEQFGWQYEQAAHQDEAREEAYRTAMEMERHGHHFYAQAAQKARDPEARKFYEFLAQEEIRHFEIIQDSLDFLTQPDAMLAMEERWMQV